MRQGVTAVPIKNVGDGADFFVFVDEVEKIAVGTSSEDLLELCVKLWRSPDGYGYGWFGHKNTSQFLGQIRGKS